MPICRWRSSRQMRNASPHGGGVCLFDSTTIGNNAHCLHEIRFRSMLLFIHCLLLICGASAVVYRDEIAVSSSNKESSVDDLPSPFSPQVECHFLPSEFYECESVEDIRENDTRACKKKNGRRFGGERYSQVEHTSVQCRVFDGIECRGNRTFLVGNIPCVKYSSHDFVTTLFYSIFLGLFAVDRYSLGHIGIAVGKMITLGGLGLWWIIDIVLLIAGKLTPHDDSNWIVQH